MTIPRTDHRGLARAITELTDLTPSALLEKALTASWPAPRGVVLGVTGPAGAGKSTIIAALAERYLAAGNAVAVVSIDPTLKSGGAVLGDRVRMAIPPAPKFFWRSLATRGSGNALWAGLPLVTALLLRAGFDRVIVETAGAGQDETGIAEQVDTLLLVLTPLAGDIVQQLKNDLLEAASAVAVNRCDEANPAALLATLAGFGEDRGAPLPVFTVTALTGAGLDPLFAALKAATPRRDLAPLWKPAARAYVLQTIDGLPDGQANPEAFFGALHAACRAEIGGTKDRS